MLAVGGCGLWWRAASRQIPLSRCDASLRSASMRVALTASLRRTRRKLSRASWCFSFVLGANVWVRVSPLNDAQYSIWLPLDVPTIDPAIEVCAAAVLQVPFVLVLQ
eukprot:IDg15133t1